METARETLSDIALPFFAGVLAARLLSVLADPLHFMYEKANKFLNKGPQWNLKKLPSYWVDKILLNPPIEEEAHYQELEWLLDTLVDGLRTPAVSRLDLPSHFSLIFYRIWSFIVTAIYWNGSCRSPRRLCYLNLAFRHC